MIGQLLRTLVGRRQPTPPSWRDDNEFDRLHDRVTYRRMSDGEPVDPAAWQCNVCDVPSWHPHCWKCGRLCVASTSLDEVS